MHVLPASMLVTIWEWGLAQSPVRRALRLLAAAWPRETLESLASLPIGQRDAMLLTLREATFGSRLTCIVRCPGCAEQLELDFAIGDISVLPGSEPAIPKPATLNGYEVHFRLPTSLDQEAAAIAPDIAAARDMLLERCLIAATRKGRGVSIGKLPPAVIDAVMRQMAEADRQADLRLDLSCPSCHHAWIGPFDIVTYFWAEIDAWARRVLREVHILASAYGWSESDILDLSPGRRGFYLQAVAR